MEPLLEIILFLVKNRDPDFCKLRSLLSFMPDCLYLQSRDLDLRDSILLLSMSLSLCIREHTIMLGEAASLLTKRLLDRARVWV